MEKVKKKIQTCLNKFEKTGKRVLTCLNKYAIFDLFKQV